MTGGGFYVVSFVSCSFCFMLKFSGRYVIKLLGVWRAQAPLFLVIGAVPAVGQMSVCPVSAHHHFPCQWLSLLPSWIWFLFGSSDTCLGEETIGVSRWLWPPLDSELWTWVLNSVWATPVKMTKMSYCHGFGWLWEEPADKGACCTMEIKLLQIIHLSFCLPIEACCDFSPTTFIVKLGTHIGLRFLFSLSVHKCLQTALSIWCQGL